MCTMIYHKYTNWTNTLKMGIQVFLKLFTCGTGSPSLKFEQKLNIFHDVILYALLSEKKIWPCLSNALVDAKFIYFMVYSRYVNFFWEFLVILQAIFIKGVHHWDDFRGNFMMGTNFNTNTGNSLTHWIVLHIFIY